MAKDPPQVLDYQVPPPRWRRWIWIAIAAAVTVALGMVLYVNRESSVQAVGKIVVVPSTRPIRLEPAHASLDTATLSVVSQSGLTQTRPTTQSLEHRLDADGLRHTDWHRSFTGETDHAQTQPATQPRIVIEPPTRFAPEHSGVSLDTTTLKVVTESDLPRTQPATRPVPSSAPATSPSLEPALPPKGN